MGRRAFWAVPGGSRATDKAPDPMPAKKHRVDPATLAGPALLKEATRRIRAARKLWDAHRNAACQRERAKAIELYERLTPAQREQVPQQLRTWLRYRSEKYFGEGRAGRGANSGSGRAKPDVKKRPETPTADDEWGGVGL